MSRGHLRGCTKGIYGLSSWEPPRQPHDSTLAELGMTTEATSQPAGASQASPSEKKPGTKGQLQMPTGELMNMPMVALYDYMGNKNTPLGIELSVRQREKLTYLGEHPENKMWVLAENTDKERGYVPHQYMHLYDDRPTSLPWLQNKEEPEPAKAANGTGYKPYKSAYAKDSSGGQNNDKSEYYCKLCEKQLNGPQPYAAHMASRGHKEELELLEDS